MKYAADIYEVIRDKFLTLNQTITNFNVGSRIRSLFESVALAIEEVWFRIDSMFQGLFAATAHGNDLDLRALELGLSRRAEKKSTGYVRFFNCCVGQDETIPVGTACSTEPDIDPVVEFLTTEEKIVVGGSHTDIPVEAKEAGESGNVEAEKVTYLPQTFPNINEIKNLKPIAGGADQEDDESLRKRIVLRWYGTSFGGCEESFRTWALEVDGVAEAQAIACWKGPGTVKIYVWSKDENDKLVPASDTLISTVQTYIDERKPICTSVTVAKPTGILVDVFVHLECASGYTFATVSENVRSAIITFFNNLGVGEDLIVSKLLAAIMAVDGVKDAKIGVPKANVDCESTDTIMLGRSGVVAQSWEKQYVMW